MKMSKKRREPSSLPSSRTGTCSGGGGPPQRAFSQLEFVNLTINLEVKTTISPGFKEWVCTLLPCTLKKGINVPAQTMAESKKKVTIKSKEFRTGASEILTLVFL
jgi:hypothetical protein